MTNPYENFDASKYPLNVTGFWENWPEHENPLDFYPPIFEQLIQELKPSVILELGSYKGKSAIQFANLCKKYNLPTKVFCVDTWLGSAEHTDSDDLMKVHGWPTMFYQFLANIIHTGHQDRVIPIPVDTMSNYRDMVINNIKVPLIYIDAGHFYESVYVDIKYYWEVLEDGGVMFGDDYEWGDVARAVKDFFGDNFTVVEGDEKVHKHWIARKGATPTPVTQSQSTFHKSW
jgi:cephalosporin hydroxylase